MEYNISGLVSSGVSVNMSLHHKWSPAEVSAFSYQVSRGTVEDSLRCSVKPVHADDF